MKMGYSGNGKNCGTALCVACCLLLSNMSAYAEDVERWGMFELAMEGPSGGNPFKDVQVNAEFRKGSASYRPDGFYDGNGTYKVRFMPGELGTWRYVTHSNRPELDGRKGEFHCVAPAEGNHGPVGVHHTFQLAHADGTPHVSWGTTCYAWAHQGDAMERQTLETLKTSPFNKLRMCVFPKHYSYNKNEPEYYVFPRDGDVNDYTRFSPEFFAHFEKRIGQLRNLGIEADIILFHPYDRWGYQSMDDATDDFYLRYVMARLSAYRNVWWSLANEYDFMRDKQKEDWDRFFQIIVKHDPYGHLRGIHNGRDWYDHSKPWVTHASLQTSNFQSAQEYRQRYQKPIIYDECRYEGNIPMGWGNISAEEMTHHFWAGTLAGCYVGHGETYGHPKDLLWWSKGGVLRGESPKRIAFLRTILEDSPFSEMRPDFDLSPGNHAMVKEGEYYLIFFESTHTQTVNLPGDTPYKVDGIDPWQMTVTPIGTASPGEFSFSVPKANYALRLTPYAPGEKRRPETKARVSVTEGPAPLSVTFSTDSTLNRQWEFANGETSGADSVTQVYEEVGQHTAKLTVTDEDEISAVSVFTIDVWPSQPKDLESFQAWPGSPDGLSFLWEGRSADNELPDERKCLVEARDDATFSTDGAMDCRTGSFLAKDMDETLLNASTKTNQLSIEAYITPSNTEQGGPARIVSFSKDSVNRNFTLGQEKDHLVLRLRTPRTGNNALSPQLNLCKIAAGKAVHVIVSYFSGHTYCFVNGEQALNTTTIQGNFSNWEPCHLLFGDEWDGNRHWAGLVEGVSIYNRFIGPDEARRKYQLFQGKKAGVERPKKVIFETDMCLDVDDVGALATLHAMADRGEAEILAVCFNEVHPSGAAAIDAINTWYHRGKIPIGIYKGPFDNPDGSKYLDYVADFPHDLTRETAPSALDVYQNVLREQPDNSVTIVSVGFLNNLYDLLKADSDLVAQKVTKLVVMGGLINDNFNLVRHNLAEESEYVIRNWPTPLVISQHGGKTRTGAKLSEASEENPVREAFYRWFSEKFEGRSSWDQIAVLYGVRGLGDYFNEITRGTGRLSNGFEWQMKPGSRAYLNARLPDNEFADIIEDLMITPPR